MTYPTVLIVEDDPMTVRLLEAHLTEWEYDIAGVCSTGAEAVSMAIETAPSVILMDIKLEGDTDGIDAADEIRRRCQIPVIYLTSHTDARTIERARLTEPFGYVVKPFNGRELHANIQMALYKHRVESRLRRVERWFFAAIDEVGDAVVATDNDGRITIFNPAAEAITQWSREQALGLRLDQVLRLADRETGAPLSLADVTEGPVVCLSDETLLIDRADRRVPIDNTTSCIRNDQDLVTGTVSVFRDPSGQRHGALAMLSADVALAAAQGVTLAGMLQMCADSLVRNLSAVHGCIWTLNTTGDTLQIMASAGIDPDPGYARFRLGEGEIGKIARERRSYLTNDMSGDMLIGDGLWARRGEMTTFAGYPLLVDDRMVGVMAVFCRRPLPESATDALESVARAIAVGIERKRLEEQLRHVQKMEAIGQLAGGIAHDFNNLLTIISGYSQIALAMPALPEDIKELMTQISAAGNRAAALTRQLLTFSRKQVVEPQVMDLNAVVADMESMLRRLLGEGIILSMALMPTAAVVTADPGQIEQVVMNLAVNSRDAMPDGGRLTIETAHVELDEAFAQTHPAAKSGRYVMLAVSDTGYGMAPEVQEHIFEPFFTTKDVGKGTGLGLSTVYGIIRQSGGYIGVYSEPGVGTTFKIYLPGCQQDVREPSGMPTAYSRRGTGTILLVEDEHPVRALTRYVLEQCGYTVIDASDGEEALMVAGEFSGEIHLLITDVVLPGIGGRIVAERLQQARPGIPVLYMSGYTDDAVIRHGILESETAFIQKPFTPAVLAEKVREMLGQGGRHGKC